MTSLSWPWAWHSAAPACSSPSFSLRNKKKRNIFFFLFSGGVGVISRVIWYSSSFLLKKKKNKTWSSVSNSSLSKTFALCQFRKLKLQKLCFLPPNIVLGLKRNECKNNFWSEKIFGSEKIWAWNKIWVRKKFGQKKNLGLKKFWVQKFLLLFLFFFLIS